MAELYSFGSHGFKASFGLLRYYYNEDEKLRAKNLGITDLNKKYLLSDLASANSMFAATGVTDGSMLKGVKIIENKAITESIVMRSFSGTVRTIKATHKLDAKI